MLEVTDGDMIKLRFKQDDDKIKYIIVCWLSDFEKLPFLHKSW